MSYDPELDIRIRHKVKHLSNWGAEKELNNAAGVDTSSSLAVKSSFVTLKSEVDKLDVNKLVNVPIGLNYLKTKVDDSDVGKLKTVPVILKKLSDAVNKKVVKNSKIEKLNAKVNSLENRIPDETTLIHINHYNTDK